MGPIKMQNQCARPCAYEIKKNGKRWGEWCARMVIRVRSVFNVCSTSRAHELDTLAAHKKQLAKIYGAHKKGLDPHRRCLRVFPLGKKTRTVRKGVADSRLPTLEPLGRGGFGRRRDVAPKGDSARLCASSVLPNYFLDKDKHD